jgi:hypothetical protein
VPSGDPDPRFQHLPAGVAPGRQSERRRRQRRFGRVLAPLMIVAGVLFCGLFVGLGLLFGALADELDGGGPDPLIFLLAGPAGLVLFAGLGVLFFRRGGRQGIEGLTVTVDRDRARRGERVTATVHSTLEQPVEVGLVCRVHFDDIVRTRTQAGTRLPGGTRSPGGSTRTVSEALVWETWAAAPQAGLGASHAFTLPADQPYSHEGEVLSFAWAVVARREGRRRLSAPAPVWVAP